MTVNELAEYLKTLQQNGLGDFKIVARVWADVCMDYDFEICDLVRGESIERLSIDEDVHEIILHEDPRTNRRRA